MTRHAGTCASKASTEGRACTDGYGLRTDRLPTFMTKACAWWMEGRRAGEREKTDGKEYGGERNRHTWDWCAGA